MRPWTSALIVACCLGTTSCTGSSLGAHRAARAQERAPSVALRFQWIEGNLRVLADGTLRATPTIWALDTGAGDHAVTRNAARRLAIEGPRSARSVTIVGSGDRVIDAMTAPVEARVFLQHPAALRALAARDQPALDAAGVAGFISPLRFERDGAIIELDLLGRTMHALDAPQGERALARLGRLGVALEDWDGGTAHALRTVHASVDGQPVRLIVDTGAPSSFVFADCAAGADASMRTVRHGRIRWPETDVALVGRATVRVGATSIDVPRLTVHPRLDSGLDGVDGVLGLDVLRACVLLLDLRSGGALACESPLEPLDTAPALDQLESLASEPPLRPRAAPLDAATLASIGCDSVSAASLSSWASERALPADAAAREAMIRAAVVEHVLSSWGLSRASIAREDRVDELIARQRVALGMIDPQSFAAWLASHGETLSTLRAKAGDALLEQWLAARVIALDPALRARVQRDPSGAIDALLDRMRDRLARVVLARSEARCEERWPAYWIEQIDWRGLDATQVTTARRALARVLRGGRVVFDATGVLPGSVSDAITRALATPTREATVVVSEEGARLALRVSFAQRSLSLRRRARRSS